MFKQTRNHAPASYDEMLSMPPEFLQNPSECSLQQQRQHQNLRPLTILAAVLPQWVVDPQPGPQSVLGAHAEQITFCFNSLVETNALGRCSRLGFKPINLVRRRQKLPLTRWTIAHERTFPISDHRRRGVDNASPSVPERNDRGSIQQRADENHHRQAWPPTKWWNREQCERITSKTRPDGG